MSSPGIDPGIFPGTSPGISPGISPALQRAYATSLYEAGGITLRLGRHGVPASEQLLAMLGARQAGFLGAANPYSQRRSAGWNTRMHAALGRAAKGAPMLSGEGRSAGGPGWTEPMWLIALPRARLARLGRQFRQNAYIMLRRGQKPRLVWCR